METAKPWYNSKTMWLNLAVGVTAALIGVFTEAGAPAWVVTALSAINMVLRTMTSKPVTFK